MESLTKDEFLQRLEKRARLLQASMAHDLEGLAIPVDATQDVNSGEIHFRMCEALGKLLAQTIVRSVDLVYFDFPD